jgi:hypothetical protein
MNNGVVTSTKKRAYQQLQEEISPATKSQQKNYTLYNCDRRSIKNLLKSIRKRTTHSLVVVDASYEESLYGCNKLISYDRICVCSCITLSDDRKKRIKITDKENSSFACELCNGRKVFSRPQLENISIPKGIKNGMIQQIEDEGDFGPEGTPGDLIVAFKVEEHPYIIREGNDAIITLLLPLSKSDQHIVTYIPTPYNGYIPIGIPPKLIHGSVLQYPNIGFFDPINIGVQGNLQIIFLYDPREKSEDVLLFKPQRTCKVTNSAPPTDNNNCQHTFSPSLNKH